MRCDDMNTLKAVTPNGIKSKDAIYVTGCKSNVFGYNVPSGYYYLCTYDECDNSCFIAVREEHIPNKPTKSYPFFTYGVPFEMVSSLEDKFGDAIAKGVEELDEKGLKDIINQLPHCEFRMEVFKKLNTVQKKNDKKK